MREPEAYIKHSIKRRDIPYLLIFKRYWVKLAAVSAVWVRTASPPLPTQLHVARLTLPPPPPALLPAFFPGSLQEFIYDFIVRSLPSIPPSEVKG